MKRILLTVAVLVLVSASAEARPHPLRSWLQEHRMLAAPGSQRSPGIPHGPVSEAVVQTGIAVEQTGLAIQKVGVLIPGAVRSRFGFGAGCPNGQCGR